ncbi:MAG: hypothetical protein J0M24_18575 [Verrucomicrobia bacterium]|nr:hypothetical protein [Verrucomicrobiota bacterium]
MRSIKNWRNSLAVWSSVASLTALHAGTFTANFDDNVVPPGTAVWGNTTVNGGVLKLTVAANDQTGGFVIENLDPAAVDGLNGFVANFKLRLGGGTSNPADGFSFCVASDLPDGTWGEEGTGSGLSVTFDIYDNGGGEAPSVDIKWAGAVVAERRVPITQLRTGAEFVDVQIKLDPDGTLDLTYNGQALYTDLAVTGFQPILGARLGIGGRTGGANENQWFDNLAITTTTGPLNVGFRRAPANLIGRLGSEVTLRSEVNDPSLVVSYQWARKAPGAATFTAIAGATSPEYTTPLLTAAEDGTQFQLTVVSAGNTLVSEPATLTVVPVVLPTPERSYTFDDAVLPDGTSLFGTATLTLDGGVGGTGVLRLTEAANSESGAFVLPDGDAAKAVGAMTARFDLQLGPGSALPADGLSFNWAKDLPDDVIGAAEEGAGTGLTVSFDTYNGGGGEAPAVDVKWGGQVVASKKLPLVQLSTGTFVEVIVRVEADGTVDVVHNGEVLHSNLALPGFAGLAGGRFGFAARTGGENQAHYVDNVEITTEEYVGPVAITQPPVPAAVLVGRTATFTAAVNDPTTTTYQWQSKAPGAVEFSDIAGATDATYVTAATTGAMNGTEVRLRATGPANTVTSDPVVLTVVTLVRPTTPTLNLDFAGAVPAGTAVFGSAAVPGDGILHLTDAENGLSGSFVIEDLNGGNAVESWTAAFKFRVGGGSEVPADGAVFAWASDLPNGSFGDAEEGVGSGLSITFDIYDNAGGEAPALGVKWKGTFLADVKVPRELLFTGDEFVEVLVRVTSAGTVDLAYRDQVIAHDIVLPGFTPVGGWRFGLGARTGGLNANQWVDDLAIQTTVAAVVVPVFVQQPVSKTVQAGYPTRLSVQVNDPARISVKWQRQAPGAAEYVDIPGATGFSYTTPILTAADSGVRYRAFATSTTANTAASDPAAFTVVDIALPAPQVTYNFNDGAQPADTALLGTATIDFNGGAGDSGKLALTIAENSQGGAFIVNPLTAENVSALVVTFKVLIGGGTATPADGMSFVWAPDLTDGVFGEDGAGTGLVVSFDTYNNTPAGSPAEAPSIDARFNGLEVGATRVPASRLDTGGYVDVIVRIESDGTFDLVFDHDVIYSNVPLPGFTGVTGGRFGFGARTGGLNANHFVDDFTIHTTTGTPVTLSLGGTTENPVITYTGVLQSSETLNGTFQDVAGAVSPYAVPTTNPARFYRAR